MNYICDDSYVNVGYRVSREFKQDIGNVFFETLEKYDMDFASYVRSIIYEYCSRADLQRELFINYDLVKNIKKAIKKESVVNIVNEGIQNELILVSIEPSTNGFNYLLGITPDKTMCYFLPLCKTERFKVGKTTVHIGQEDYNKILEKFSKFIEENDWCSDQINTKPLNGMCVVVIGEAILLIVINTSIALLVEQEKNKIDKNVSLLVNTPQLFRTESITLIICSQVYNSTDTIRYFFIDFFNIMTMIK